MVQKTYYKTKEYCKVKFSFTADAAETIEILGLNSDWKKSVIMSKKKDGTFSADVNLHRLSPYKNSRVGEGAPQPYAIWSISAPRNPQLL